MVRTDVSRHDRARYHGSLCPHRRQIAQIAGVSFFNRERRAAVAWDYQHMSSDLTGQMNSCEA